MTRSLRLPLVLLGTLSISGSAVQVFSAQPGSRHTPCAVADGTRRVPATYTATLLDSPVLAIRLDGAREGRTFEGLGALGAGAASRS